jgi:aspartate carbamoyltransferase regulatory subunit
MTKPKIKVKIIKNGEVVKSITSRKTKRIYSFLKADKFQDCLFSVRVTYDKGIINESAEYQTKDELIYALKVFLEPGTY